MSRDWHVTVNHEVAPALHAAAMRGVTIAAEHILGEAKKIVPIEEHILEQSGNVSTDENSLRASIYFDTPYAVPVHEIMTARHDEGRTAKFLEIPFTGEVDTAREIIAQAIRGEL
jgi:hypothetical protein